MTRAERTAAIAVVLLAAAIGISYGADRLGFGLVPWVSTAAAVAAAAGVALGVRRTGPERRGETAAFMGIGGATLVYLLWLAWPSLLPLGSGSDLTHHLLLVDYLERHGELPYDSTAVEYLGEMADYTPGLHLLTVIAGAVARTNGFHALYPLIAFSVAVKFGIFLLILVRLLAHSPIRVPLAIAGVIAVLTAPTYSLGSFVDDSFLAQVVSELFAVTAWWALVWWDTQPGRLAMGLFALAGVAVVLTWPIWIGPPALTLAVLLLTRRGLVLRERILHGAIASVPIALVVIAHAIGRLGQVSIVSTSGAVVPPSPAVLGWVLPVLAIGGLAVALRMRRARSLTVVGGAIAAQAAALWLVAAGQTPYMAIKMMYLAIYPAAGLAIVLVDVQWPRIAGLVPARVGPRAALAVAWIAVFAAAFLVRHDVPLRSQMRPVVSNDLAAAGLWARAHVPVGCVDYLVANEYTAYWLHLAVLGNPRISPRTGNDDTFLTQPSMARWLAPGSPQYAIANLAILPAEIVGDVNVLRQFGQAAVVERRAAGGCP